MRDHLDITLSSILEVVLFLQLQHRFFLILLSTVHRTDNEKTIRYSFAVIYLSVAQEEQMRILVQPHRLHSVEAVDDSQPVKSQVSILQKNKNKKERNIDKRNLRDENNVNISKTYLDSVIKLYFKRFRSAMRYLVEVFADTGQGLPVQPE